MSRYLLKLKNLLPFFLLAESVSYLGHYLPYIETIGFWIIVVVAFYLAFKKYEYLIALLLSELIIGSKGHLFNIALGNFNLSIRMIIWFLAITFWAYYAIVLLKNSPNFKKDAKEILFISKLSYFWPLLFFIAFATINGVLQANNLGNIYKDGNAWLYFILLWPVALIKKNWDGEKQTLFTYIAIVAITWLTIKTWIILYFFSHEFIIIGDFYKWIRVSGVGEITEMKKSFFRIFIQSHIYPLLALVITWYYIGKLTIANTIRELINNRKYLFLLCISASLLSIILIGLSRSFWVGLVVAVATMLILVIRSAGEPRKIYYALSRLSVSLVASLFLALFIIFAIIKFPFPNNTIDFDATSVLSERATETNESAIGSRWALLPVLSEAIKKHWMLGQGFGATITYTSKDPRVIQNTGGSYTTFAFEWGWLDLWLKLGIIGLISYIYVLHCLWKMAKNQHNKNEIRLALITLITLHIFTPYLNHPLGIGVMLVLACIIEASPTLPNRIKSYILQVIKIRL